MKSLKKINKSIISGAVLFATMTLAGCSTTMEQGKYADGTHDVSAKGKKGLITLTVEVENGHIVDIKTKSHNETESLYLNAERLLSQIVAKNGHEGIDAVSGATYSSNGILEAINSLPRANGS